VDVATSVDEATSVVTERSVEEATSVDDDRSTLVFVTSVTVAVVVYTDVAVTVIVIMGA
jgi:hypothetical protein